MRYFWLVREGIQVSWDLKVGHLARSPLAQELTWKDGDAAYLHGVLATDGRGGLPTKSGAQRATKPGQLKGWP